MISMKVRERVKIEIISRIRMMVKNRVWAEHKVSTNICYYRLGQNQSDLKAEKI